MSQRSPKVRPLLRQRSPHAFEEVIIQRAEQSFVARQQERALRNKSPQPQQLQSVPVVQTNGILLPAISTSALQTKSHSAINGGLFQNNSTRLYASSPPGKSVNDSYVTENLEHEGQTTNQNAPNNNNMPQIAKLSNVIYILGALSSDLLHSIENQKRQDQLSRTLIEQMRAEQFVQTQQSRTAKFLSLFQKFIIEKLLAHQGREREGHIEIGNLMKREIAAILELYEFYILNQEENLRRAKLFQDKEVMFITDFYEGVQMILDSYNHLFKEMGAYGKTRPGQSVYQKSVLQFKSLLRGDKQKNDKVVQLLDELEAMLRAQTEKIDAQNSQIEKLQSENGQLTKLYQETLSKNNDLEILKTQLLKGKDDTENDTLDKQIKKKYGLSVLNTGTGQSSSGNENNVSAIHLKALEDFYVQTVTRLKEEKVSLEKELEQTMKKVRTLEQSLAAKEKELQKIRQIEERERERVEQQRRLMTLNRQDKEVQCAFVRDYNPISRREGTFTNIILNPLPNLKQANRVQSREWVLSVIGAVYQDRLVADLWDEVDGRAYCEMRHFVAQWFLKQFATREIAEALLKDFLLCLKQYANLSERFRIFAEFCDLEDLIELDHDANAINSLGLNRIKFRRQYMQTPEALKLYLRCAHIFKTTGQSFNGSSAYLPILPNILLRGADLISFEVAHKMFEVVLEENQEKTDISSIEQQYRKALGMDMSDRHRGALKVYNEQTEEDEDQFIRFDFLVRQLLEMSAKQRFSELESLYASMMLKNSARNECAISFDDFHTKIQKLFPTRSERWIEITYKEFINGALTEKTPLQQAILKIVPLLCDSDCVRQNPLKIDAQLFITIQKGVPVVQQNSALVPTHSMTLSQLSKAQVKKESVALQLLDVEKDKIRLAYDHATQLALLEETYKIIQPLILQKEKNNDALVRQHQIYTEDISGLPVNIMQKIKYDDFTRFDRDILREHIETVWIRFRNILTTISRPN